MTVQMHRRLKYSDIFSDTSRDLDEYLRPIGKIDLFKAVAFFIKRSTKPNNFPSAKDLVFDWFANDLKFRDHVMTYLRPDHAILNITSSLRFAELVFNSDYPVNNNISDAVLERNIFIVYLLFNEQQENEEQAGFSVLPDRKSDNYLSSLFLCMAYQDYEFNNSDLHNVFICQVVKSILFFNYLEQRQELEPHLQYFLKEFKKDTWQEWMKAYLALVSLIIFQNNEKYNDIILPNNDEIEQNQHFFQMLSLNDVSLEQDYISIRSNPLLQVGENHYRIIYDLFLVEKLFKSIQFKFSLDINKNIDKQYKLGDFRADHCDKFSEQTLLYTLMERSFPKKWIHISGVKFKTAGFNNAEPDYYLRNGNKIFLFESKDVILKGEEKQSRDFQVLSNALKSKFYFSVDKNERTENKAVLQLMTNIYRILQNEYSAIDVINPANIRIYPIIVTHDRQFDSMGVNKLVSEWFNNELNSESKWNLCKQHKSQIFPPTIINIDTFILYHDLLKCRTKLIFEELISRYHEQADISRLRNKSMSQEVFNSKVQQSLISFQAYLDDIVLKKGMVKFPSIAEDYLAKLSDHFKE
ncbi:MAG: hypothetical protein WAT21_08225 [Saprospiraceae bacterium]